nr:MULTISPECIES: ATP-binding cassette domain-containing protein [unclassified Actinomyces]
MLEDVSLTVVDGERACLVGPNGCGKTTLLRLVTGTLVPDSGSAVVTGLDDGRCGLRPALDVLTMTGSIGSYLDAATAALRALPARFDEVATALARSPSAADQTRLAREYDHLLAAMSAADVWGLDARVEQTLTGLGLGALTGPDGRGRDLATLSPGQRGRLELAATLLASPSALVLDEPTNHLDDEAIAYLAAFLTGFSGPVLLASHDRAFLDDVATVLLDLDTAPWQALATAEGAGALPGVQRCAGTYTDYLVLKAAARAGHAALHAAQQGEKKGIRDHRRASEDIARGGVRLKEAARKERKFFADRASKTFMRRAHNDDRQMEALTAREVRRPREYRLHLDLPPVAARGGLALTARRAAVPGRLAPVTLDLRVGEHLLLTGPNGCGKSTLLRWAATGRAPVARTTGTLTLDGALAVVPQRLPRPGDPGLDERTWASGIGELGAGVLHPAYWHRCVGELSAGNQRRVQLALAVAAAPEVLVIDEPTNYLDLDTLEALEQALARWTGTLLVASHDRWLTRHWAGQRLEMLPARPAVGAVG